MASNQDKAQAEKVIRDAVNQALRANVGGAQISTWVTEELIDEVDGGRKRDNEASV